MNKTVKIIALLPLIILSSCATTQTSFFDRSVIEDKVGKTDNFGTLALTGERRLAIFRGETICAEALPDVAVSRESESKVSAELKDIASASGTFTNDERYKTALEVLYKRTEKSDLIRQIGWQLCQAHMNNALDKGQYAEMLTVMMAAALSADAPNSLPETTESLKSLFSQKP